MKLNRMGNTVSILIFITAFSQIISFVRESVFAYYYGTNVEADIYVIASQIPVTLFAVISSAVNTIMLPLYIEKKETQGILKAQSFLKSSICIFTVFSVIFVIFAELAAEMLVSLFAPGFEGEVKDTIVLYIRILLPTTIWTLTINILTACFNSSNNFSYPVTASMIQNIAIIVSMLAIARALGVMAAVLGTVIGIVLNFIFLAIPYKEILFASIDLKETWSDLKRILCKIGPVTLGVGVAEINQVIDRALASGMDTGSITALNYANKLSVAFSALILSGIATVSFKKFSEFYAKKNFEQYDRTLTNYVVLLVSILLPITIGAILFRKELIAVVFGRGAFDIDSIVRTAEIFTYSALGIVFIAVRDVLSKYYYAQGNTKTPMINAGIGLILNIFLNLVLSKFMGVSGLALATTIANIAVCVLLFASILKTEPEFYFIGFIKKIFVPMISALCMCIILLILDSADLFSNIGIELIFNTIAGGGIFMCSFYVLDKALMKELMVLLFKQIN